MQDQVSKASVVDASEAYLPRACTRAASRLASDGTRPSGSGRIDAPFPSSSRSSGKGARSWDAQ